MLEIFSSDKFAEMPFLFSQPQNIQPPYRLCPCLPRNVRVNDILKWKLISAANGVFHSPWEVLLIEKTKWKSRRHAEPSRWQTHPRCTWDEWLTIAARSTPRFYLWKRNTSTGFLSLFHSFFLFLLIINRFSFCFGTERPMFAVLPPFPCYALSLSLSLVFEFRCLWRGQPTALVHHSDEPI